MYLNKFRSFLLATSVCTQIMFSGPSFAQGTFKVEAHREFIDLFQKRTQLKKVEQVDASTKEQLTSLNKGLKAKIKSLEKAFKIGSTEDFQDNTNKQKYVDALKILSIQNDIKEALDYITPTVEGGFIPAIFLAASCNELLDRPKEAVALYVSAIRKEDNSAYNELLFRSKEVNPADKISVHATFGLGEYYMRTGESKAASSCFDRLKKCDQQEYPQPLLEGLRCQANGKISGAWQAFKVGAKTDPDLFNQRLDSLLFNPRAFFSLLTASQLSEPDKAKGTSSIAKHFKNNEDVRSEFQRLAISSPEGAYYHACFLLESLPQDDKTRTKQVKAAFHDLVFAASKGYKQATSKVVSLAEEKKLKLSEDMLDDLELITFYRSTLYPLLKTEVQHQPPKQRKKPTRKEIQETKKTTSDWLREAQDFEKSGDIAQATLAFEKACETNEPEAVYAEGMFYYNRYLKAEDKPKDLLKNAERSLKKAAKKGHAGASFELGNLYYATKQFELATEYWEKGHLANHWECSFCLAKYYKDVEDNQTKFDNYLSAAATYGMGPALFKISMYLIQKGNLNDASANLYAGVRQYDDKACLDKLTELAESKVPYAILNLGVCYYYKADFLTARKHWEHLQTFTDLPKDCKALLTFNMGRLELSMRDLKHGEKKDEEAAKHMKLAEDHFLQAVILGHIEANFALGRIYFHKSQIQDAKLYLEAANELMPNNKEVLYYVGVIDINEGRKDAGFDKLLDANKLGNGDVIPFLAEMYKGNNDPQFALGLGQCLLNNGKLKAAVPYFEPALKSENVSLRKVAMSSLVEVYTQLQDYDNTKKYAEMCIQERNFEFVANMRTRVLFLKDKHIQLAEKSLKSAQIAERVLKEVGVDLIDSTETRGKKQVVAKIAAPPKSRVQQDAELGSTLAQVTLALTSFRNGKYPLAQEELKHALEMGDDAVTLLEDQTLNEQDPNVLHMIGKCLLAEKRYSYAISFFFKARVKDYHDKVESYSLISDTYYKSGNDSLGLHFKKLAEKKPEENKE